MSPRTTEYASFEDEDGNWLRRFFDARKFRERVVWRTKDGRVMDIADMTDSHLSNALAMMQRRKASGGLSMASEAVLLALAEEVKKRDKAKCDLIDGKAPRRAAGEGRATHKPKRKFTL